MSALSKVSVLLFSLFCATAAHAATLLVYGDSLSAGYGIAVEQSWPSLLARRIDQQHLPYSVVNASISGETTAGGRSRLPDILKRAQPAVMILALGANDGLRGLSLAQSRENLVAMIRTAKAAGTKVLLVGMQLPPNYGPDYTRGFAAIYRELARREKVALLPFLLEPIALDDGAYQADRLHPTAAVQPMILDHVWQALAPLLKGNSPGRPKSFPAP